MNVCMYVSCMHVYMHMCMQLCMHVSMHLCTYVACMHVCLYVCGHVYMHVCVHVCMYRRMIFFNVFWIFFSNRCRCTLDSGDAILDCPPTFTMYAFDAAVNDAKVVSGTDMKKLLYTDIHNPLH